MEQENKNYWGNIKDSYQATKDFLKTGRRLERKQEPGYELYRKFNKMSDDEFDAAYKNGDINEDDIRKAGEYAFDVYMGDVWSEGDHDGEKEPTYEEFMSDPGKYGFVEYDVEPWNFHRFNPNRYKK